MVRGKRLTANIVAKQLSKEVAVSNVRDRKNAPTDIADLSIGPAKAVLGERVYNRKQGSRQSSARVSLPEYTTNEDSSRSQKLNLPLFSKPGSRQKSPKVGLPEDANGDGLQSQKSDLPVHSKGLRQKSQRVDQPVHRPKQVRRRPYRPQTTKRPATATNPNLNQSAQQKGKQQLNVTRPKSSPTNKLLTRRLSARDGVAPDTQTSKSPTKLDHPPVLVAFVDTADRFGLSPSTWKSDFSPCSSPLDGRSIMSGDFGDSERSVSQFSFFSSLRGKDEAGNNTAGNNTAGNNTAGNNTAAFQTESETDTGDTSEPQKNPALKKTRNTSIHSLRQSPSPPRRDSIPKDSGKPNDSTEMVTSSRSAPKKNPSDKPKSPRRVKAIRERAPSRDYITPQDHHFDVEFRRGPVLQAEPSFTDMQMSTPPLPPDSPCEDSEGYDTDLEIKDDKMPWSFDASGRTRYLALCERNHVAPCSVYLRQAADEKVNLKYYGLGYKQVLPMACSFLDNTYVTNVDLSYNNIGSEGVYYIAHSLKENHHITRLDLNYCFLGQCKSGALSLYYLLTLAKFISELSVSHNGFHAKDLPWFTKMLHMEELRLTYLNLSDNNFGNLGMKEFSQALSDNETLQFFDIGWNPIMPDGCSLLLKGLTRNVELLYMGLRHVGLNNRCVPHIIKLVQLNDFMTKMDLTLNHLETKSIDKIKKIHDKVGSAIDIKF